MELGFTREEFPLNLAQLLHVTLRVSAPISLAALGGLFALRVGVFNIAIEGFMLMGCFAAVVGTHFAASPYIGIICAMLVSMFMTLIYAFFVLNLNVDPIICALASISVSTGLTRYLLRPIFGTSGRFILPSDLGLRSLNLPLLEKIPLVGEVLSGHSIIVYISWILVVVAYVVLYKTSFGLSIRATGLKPEAAASAGIPTRRVQYIALSINGLLCGLAGAELALGFTNMFNEGMTNGRGFTALAALILANSEPIATFGACLLFGLSEAIVIALSSEGYAIQLLSMLPYLLAIIVALLPPVASRISKLVKATPRQS